MIIDDITNKLIQHTIDDGGKVYVFNETDRFEVVSANNGEITINSGNYEFGVNDKLSFVYLPKYKTPYIVNDFVDTDGDGLVDEADWDADGDGVLDERKPLAPTIIAVEAFVLPLAPSDVGAIREPLIPTRVKTKLFGEALAVDGYYPLYLTEQEALNASPLSVPDAHEHILSDEDHPDDTYSYWMPLGVHQWHGTYRMYPPEIPSAVEVSTFNTYGFEYVDRVFTDRILAPIRPLNYNDQLIGIDRDESGTFDTTLNYDLVREYNVDDQLDENGNVIVAGDRKYDYYHTSPEQAWVFDVVSKDTSENTLPGNDAFYAGNHSYQLTSVGKFDHAENPTDAIKHTQSIFRYFTSLVNGQYATFDSVGAVKILYYEPEDDAFRELSILEARNDGTIIMDDDILDVGQRFYLVTEPPPSTPSNIQVEVAPPPSIPSNVEVQASPKEPTINYASLMPKPSMPSFVNVEIFSTAEFDSITYNGETQYTSGQDFTILAESESTLPVTAEPISDFVTISNNVVTTSLVGDIVIKLKTDGNADYRPAETNIRLNMAELPAEVTAVVAILLELPDADPTNVTAFVMTPPVAATALSIDTIPFEVADTVGILTSPASVQNLRATFSPYAPSNIIVYDYDARPAGFRGGEPFNVQVKEVFRPAEVSGVVAYDYNNRPAGYPFGGPTNVVAKNTTPFAFEEFLRENGTNTVNFSKFPLFYFNGMDDNGKSLLEYGMNPIFTGENDLGDQISGWYLDIHTGLSDDEKAFYEDILNREFQTSFDYMPEVGKHERIRIADKNGNPISNLATSWRIGRQYIYTTYDEQFEASGQYWSYLKCDPYKYGRCWNEPTPQDTASYSYKFKGTYLKMECRWAACRGGVTHIIEAPRIPSEDFSIDTSIYNGEFAIWKNDFMERFDHDQIKINNWLQARNYVSIEDAFKVEYWNPYVYLGWYPNRKSWFPYIAEENHAYFEKQIPMQRYYRQYSSHKTPELAWHKQWQDQGWTSFSSINEADYKFKYSRLSTVERDFMNSYGSYRTRSLSAGSGSLSAILNIPQGAIRAAVAKGVSFMHLVRDKFCRFESQNDSLGGWKGDFASTVHLDKSLWRDPDGSTYIANNVFIGAVLDTKVIAQNVINRTNHYFKASANDYRDSTYSGSPNDSSLAIVKQLPNEGDNTILRFTPTTFMGRDINGHLYVKVTHYPAPTTGILIGGTTLTDFYSRVSYWKRDWGRTFTNSFNYLVSNESSVHLSLWMKVIGKNVVPRYDDSVLGINENAIDGLVRSAIGLSYSQYRSSIVPIWELLELIEEFRNTPNPSLQGNLHWRDTWTARWDNLQPKLMAFLLLNPFWFAHFGIKLPQYYNPTDVVKDGYGLSERRMVADSPFTLKPVPSKVALGNNYVSRPVALYIKYSPATPSFVSTNIYTG